MQQSEAHFKVLSIIDREPRLAQLVEKEPRFLHLLNVAASQSISRVNGNRWDIYESLKKTYKELVRSSDAKRKLSSQEHEVLVAAIDELLPVLSTHEILQLEFAEPDYDEYGEEY